MYTAHRCADGLGTSYMSANDITLFHSPVVGVAPKSALRFLLRMKRRGGLGGRRRAKSVAPKPTEPCKCDSFEEGDWLVFVPTEDDQTVSSPPANRPEWPDRLAQQHRRVEGLRIRLLQHLGSPDVESCFPALRAMATPAVLEIGDGRRLGTAVGCTRPLSTECQKAVTYFNDLMKACHQLEMALSEAVHTNEQDLKGYDKLSDHQSERAYSYLKRLQQDLARWMRSNRMILEAVDAQKTQLSEPKVDVT